MLLSATRSVFFDWIPASAGMTAQWIDASASPCQTIPGLPATPFNFGTLGAVTLTTFSLRK
jgi:hypothetical protein